MINLRYAYVTCCGFSMVQLPRCAGLRIAPATRLRTRELSVCHGGLRQLRVCGQHFGRQRPPERGLLLPACICINMRYDD